MKEEQRVCGGLEHSCTTHKTKILACPSSHFSRLPESLVTLILASLPIPDILRATSVCKLWKSLATSRHFARIWRQTTAPSPWVLLRVSSTSEAEAKERLDAMYECDGMERFKEPETQHHEWKELPSPPLQHANKDTRGFQGLKVAMVVDPASLAYKVVVLADSFFDSPEKTFAIFDSNTGSWQLSSAKPRTGIPLRGSLFLIEPFLRSLVAYDLDRCLWSELPLSRSNIHCLHFYSQAFQYKGRIMLATVLSTDGSLALGFAVYELQEESRTWELLSMMTLESWYGADWKQHCWVDVSEFSPYFRFDTQENLVVVSIFYHPILHGLWPPVACNLDDTSWHVLHQDFQPHINYQCQGVFIPSLQEEP